MTKRLQILLDDIEYRELQRAARSRKMSITAWVRQALSIVRRRDSSCTVANKLEAIRVAARFEFPTAEIDAMWAEIESGYRAKTDL
jgi:hypothetical protein